MKTNSPNASIEIMILVAFVALLFVFWVFKGLKHDRNWNSGRRYPALPKYQRSGINSELKLNERKLDDIQYVLSAKFQRRRLLNFEEYELFQRLENLVSRNTEGLRLFAQVSLGEILESSDPAAFSRINSKRCDFLVVDKNCNPVIAIEYHGRGHFQADSAHRDEVKRLALRKASIPTVEVLFDYEWIDVQSELIKELGNVFS
ncbi:MAG: DUF2726 domain-containing protein [Alphaproteobacteria bacterium]|nr:DUF2726 domain-containing protein [Alphaproteobacteria bacterium]